MSFFQKTFTTIIFNFKDKFLWKIFQDDHLWINLVFTPWYLMVWRVILSQHSFYIKTKTKRENVSSKTARKLLLVGCILDWRYMSYFKALFDTALVYPEYQCVGYGYFVCWIWLHSCLIKTALWVLSSRAVDFVQCY